MKFYLRMSKIHKLRFDKRVDNDCTKYLVRAEKLIHRRAFKNCIMEFLSAHKDHLSDSASVCNTTL